MSLWKKNNRHLALISSVACACVLAVVCASHGENPPEAKADTDTPSTTPAARVVLGDPALVAGIPGEGPLTLDQARAFLDDPANMEVLEVELPFGMSGAAANIQGLDSNTLTRAKIELGRQLYFDTRMSGDNTISCASCHDPNQGYTTQTAVSSGIGGQLGGRNAPVSFNRIVSGPQFWDGRAASLEDQAKGPIENPIEHGFTHDEAVEAVSASEVYQLEFARIFPDEGITIDTIAQAIAAFERVLVTGPAPYDYYEVVRSFEQGLDEEDLELELEIIEEEDPELFARYQEAKEKAEAMSESARRGRELFFTEKANCTACHSGANFSDEQYHNLGVGMEVEGPDEGRFVITGNEADIGAYKTPTLRNIALTGPYMHDGSQETLLEVVEWYAQGGHPNPHLSDKIKALELTDQDKADLVAFMEALTGDLPPVEEGRLPE